jgi:hypothetical protein
MRLILIVLGILFLVRLLGLVLTEPPRVPFIFIVNYFALRIVVIYLFFFSIYALLAKIETTRKLESPVVLVIIGAIFVILSYGPPIVAYLITHDYEIDLKRSHLDAGQVSKEAVNANNMSGKRYGLVEDYYFETGERLPWLDNNNKVTIYTPDEKAMERLKLRRSLVESERMLNRSRANLRTTAFSLIGLLITSSFCFIGFIWYRFPRSQ